MPSDIARCHFFANASWITPAALGTGFVYRERLKNRISPIPTLRSKFDAQRKLHAATASFGTEGLHLNF